MSGVEEFKQIKDTMLWKGAALTQIAAFEDLGRRLGLTLEVAGSHKSKSIALPVPRIAFDDEVSFFIRDNFYDLNVCVRSKAPVNLSLAAMLTDVCSSHDWAWYLDEVAKCRGYAWRDWTDEQMDDPMCLRRTPTAQGASHDVKSTEEKDRWIKRLSSPEWYTHHWSSGELSWDGAFGPGVTLFDQRRAFAEGIGNVVPYTALRPYKPGVTEFTLAVGSLEQVELVMRRVVGVPLPVPKAVRGPGLTSGVA